MLRRQAGCCAGLQSDVERLERSACKAAAVWCFCARPADLMACGLVSAVRQQQQHRVLCLQTALTRLRMSGESCCASTSLASLTASSWMSTCIQEFDNMRMTTLAL